MYELGDILVHQRILGESHDDPVLFVSNGTIRGEIQLIKHSTDIPDLFSGLQGLLSAFSIGTHGSSWTKLVAPRTERQNFVVPSSTVGLASF